MNIPSAPSAKSPPPWGHLVLGLSLSWPAEPGRPWARPATPPAEPHSPGCFAEPPGAAGRGSVPAGAAGPSASAWLWDSTWQTGWRLGGSSTGSPQLGSWSCPLCPGGSAGLLGISGEVEFKITNIAGSQSIIDKCYLKTVPTQIQKFTTKNRI